MSDDDEPDYPDPDEFPEPEDFEVDGITIGELVEEKNNHYTAECPGCGGTGEHGDAAILLANLIRHVTNCPPCGMVTFSQQ